MQKGSKNNRIYSENGKDKAEGFIPTFYIQPLMYADKPYFCPNGWRRYGLYVGLSQNEFA